MRATQVHHAADHGLVRERERRQEVRAMSIVFAIGALGLLYRVVTA